MPTRHLISVGPPETANAIEAESVLETHLATKHAAEAHEDMEVDNARQVDDASPADIFVAHLEAHEAMEVDGREISNDGVDVEEHDGLDTAP